MNASTEQRDNRRIAGAVALLVLTLAAYTPALRAGFTWDDESHVTDNMALRAAGGLRDIWFGIRSHATPQYYPLTFTAFWLQYRLWGLEASGYHLVNILFQGLDAILLWALLRRLKAPAAWLGAAIFAVHPVNVMSVAWVTELKNVLAGFFMLASTLAYLRFEEEPRSRAAYAASLVLFACGILSKTAAGILPLALFLLVWARQKGLSRRAILPLVPFAVLGIALGWITIWVEQVLVVEPSEAFRLSYPQRLVLSGQSFWFYVSKLAWPARLSFLYPQWPIPATSWKEYLPLAGAAALLGALWIARRRWGKAPFAAVLYYYAAVSGLILAHVLRMVNYTYVSDHWQFFGLMSAIPLAAGAAARLIGPRARPALRAAGGGAVVLALAVLTFQQCGMYKDQETLWRETLKRNPLGWMAYGNLANILQSRGDTDEAVTRYRQALEIRPNDIRAHYNLGNALAQKGEFNEAIGHFERAIELMPGNDWARSRLGILFAMTGKTNEAMELFQQILDRQDSPPARVNLGRLLLARGRTDDAIAQFQAALRTDPGSIPAHMNLAMALQVQGRPDDAVLQYRAARQARPDDPEILRSAAAALVAHTNLAAAVSWYEDACAASPDDPALRIDTARAYSELGRVPDSIRHLRELLRIDPASSIAMNNLAWFFATGGDTNPAVFAEALALAEKLTAVHGTNSAWHMGTLAAALAANGQFTQAVHAAQASIRAAEAAGDETMAGETRARLERYKAGRRWVESQASVR